jgi:DNA polymerase-3 subunit epsilon
MTAMAPLALQRWPFAGAIAWREAAADGFPWHVIEDWCYLGSAATLEAAAQQLAAPARFDVDTYQILAPRIEALQATAVPLDSTRTFALTAPTPPEPKPASAPRASARRMAKSGIHPQITDLFG